MSAKATDNVVRGLKRVAIAHTRRQQEATRRKPGPDAYVACDVRVRIAVETNIDPRTLKIETGP
jgi:hypothetical protein